LTDDSALDDTRMSIGQHLEELRWHVLKAVGYVFVAFLLAFYLQAPLLDVATWPYERAAKNVRDTRAIPGVEAELREVLVEISDGYSELDQELNKAAKDELFLLDKLDPGQLTEKLEALQVEQGKLKEEIAALQAKQAEVRERETEVSFDEVLSMRAEREALLARQDELEAKVDGLVGPFKDRMARLPRMELTQIRPQEAFLSALKLSLVVALFCASPLVARELWSFVGKGLYTHEKKYVRFFAPLTVVAFGIGTMFGYFVLIPYGVEFLIGYLPDVSGSISFGEYLKLFTLLTVLVGIIFELPLVMVFLTLIGVGNAALYRRYAKYWFMAAFVIGAVLTPPDPVTQILMAVPLVGLFWVGVIASAMVGKRVRETGEEESTPPPPSSPPAALPSSPTPSPAAPPASPTPPPAAPASSPTPPQAAPADPIPVLAPPEGTLPQGAAIAEQVAPAPEPADPEAADPQPGPAAEADAPDDDDEFLGEEFTEQAPTTASAPPAAAAAVEGEELIGEEAPAQTVPKVAHGSQQHYTLSPEELAAVEAAKREGVHPPAVPPANEASDEDPEPEPAPEPESGAEPEAEASSPEPAPEAKEDDVDEDEEELDEELPALDVDPEELERMKRQVASSARSEAAEGTSSGGGSPEGTSSGGGSPEGTSSGGGEGDA